MNLKKLKIKNISFLLMILFITVNINAQNFFKYKISKTYNVFIFMETAISSHGTSSTFENFIVEKTKNNIEFQNIKF